MKRCSRCKLNKPHTEFGGASSRKDGLRPYCKSCRHERYKERKIAIKEHLKINPIDLRQLKQCSQCKIKKPNIEFNKHCGNSSGLSTRCKSCDYQSTLLWQTKNKKRSNAHKLKARKKRLSHDTEFKFKDNFRARMCTILKGFRLPREYEQYFSCSITEVLQHISNQWTEGMSWDNWTVKGWHIDHIKPLALFNMRIEADRYTAWHYTNLQPLWAKDNLSKGSKIKGE